MKPKLEADPAYIKNVFQHHLKSIQRLPELLLLSMESTIQVRTEGAV